MNVDNLLTTEECMVIPEPAYNVTFSYDRSVDVLILPDSSHVNSSDVQPVSRPTVQEVSVPGPPKITALSTSIYIAEPVIKNVPEKRKSKISHVSHDATHIMSCTCTYI